ncbi:endonuclease [Blastopirellula marina]|uniref:Endonuclease n=1 Tax=Blastopirellula marina TaxID=124 RepID=A0A2S8F1T1_9BACT|nr:MULTISPECIES: endonuclease/exonuclease/phosphatase family protein [Pirellulaceae]PQO26093.1 endonuclease [Blastopirellula marina]RCS44451.1 endonuclease [Bremerella cremea]
MRTFLLLSVALLAGMTVSTLFGAEPNENAVEVMSFNIRYGTAKDGENHWDKRKEFVAETIQQVNSDLLGTQECLGFQRDFLAKHLPGYQVHAAAREDGKEQGEMCAIFYRTDRFEKLDAGHFWLSEAPDVPGSKSWDSSLPRMASWVKLKDKKAPDAKPIVYINTHFDHRGPDARFESAKMIREKISQFADADVILTGDFNADEGSKPYIALFAEESPVVDTYRTIHPEKKEGEGTFSNFDVKNTGGARIDWIGVGRGWNVVEAKILPIHRDGHTPSDHLPITAKLTR